MFDGQAIRPAPEPDRRLRSEGIRKGGVLKAADPEMIPDGWSPTGIQQTSQWFDSTPDAFCQLGIEV